MTVTVKVRNKERLARKLHSLAPEALKDLTDANLKAAQEMTVSARNFVPVRSGALRDSIRTEFVGGDTGAVRVLAGGPSTTKPVRAGFDGSYDYALGQEFGTTDTPAQPFFYPSYRLINRKHKGRASRALNKSVKRVAR